MTKERFEEIQKMSEEERLELSKEELSDFYDYIVSTSNTSVSIPTEVYVEAGVEVATESLLISTNTSEKILKTTQELSKGVTPTQTVGTVGKVAIFLSMATNIYSMVKGSFKWDLANTVNILSSTLSCLVLLGINVACLGAIATILASTPFTIALAVVSLLINYFDIGNMASKIKKMYMSCFNSYRRIYKLCNWCNTNEIVYKNFKSVLDFAKQEIEKIKEEFINSVYYQKDMRRKIFVGADFNSFILFNNVITFIQSKQELSTVKNGVYNDYIDFCSIEDYIDTHEILKQDLARIEYFILQNDLKGLKDFVISIDFLVGYFDTYKNNLLLTKETKKDIDYVLSCVKKLKSAIGEQGLTDLKNENSEFKNVRNPEELFNSIYSYLIYANSMRNSPFVVSSTLLNPQYYSQQNIYEYVSAFSEYPVYLFSNWYFHFGNIMFNDIYIEKYKKELVSAYNSNKSLYTETFYKDLVNDIENYDNFKVCLIWLNSIKEFFKNLINYEYNSYSPYFATSFTQTGIEVEQDGKEKVLYNYYLPKNDYLIPQIKTVIGNFVKYFKENGYMNDKFSYLLDEFSLFKDYNKKVSIPFISLDCINSLFSKYDYSGVLGKFNNIQDNIESLGNQTYILGFKKYYIKDSFEYFKKWWNSTYAGHEYFNLTTNPYFLNGAYKGSVNNDSNNAFGKTQEFDINDLEYYGTSENAKDFFTRILLKTRDLRYVFAYLVLIFDGRWSIWGNSFFEVAYLLGKSKKLRDLFFDGYNFKTTKDFNTYLYSLWQFIRGDREDIIFYWYDTDGLTFNIYTFVTDMLNNSNKKEEIKNLYNSFKNVFNNFRNNIKNEYEKVDNMISNELRYFQNILVKYPQFDSSLSYSYTGKYDVYLWNIYKMAQSLGLNNYSYLEGMTKHLVPVYKLEDGFIQLETYYSPMFILLNAKDDTDLSQSYYLVNQEALNNLFKIGDEKFEEKVKEYKDLVSLTIQPEIAVINHQEIIADISENIKAMYSLNKEEMIDLIGSQEDEYILIQNLINQEILEKYVRDNDTVETEITDIISTNKSLAQSTQNTINENKLVLDKNKIIKYAMVSSLALILLNRGK